MKFLLAYFFCLTSICSTAAAQDNSAFTKRFFAAGPDTLHYRLLYPQHYHKHKHYPLVIFLHGDCERGSDNERQLYAMPKALTDSLGREKFSCFILAPQCPRNRLWVHFPNFPKSLKATPMPTLPAQWTFLVIGQLIDELPVDTHRIYITGYSGGGEGTFDWLTRRPGLFAAAIPLCSVSDTAKADLIKHIPIWAFHGGQDEINNVKYSRLMIAALQKQGGRPRYTEYPELGHNIIARAYNEPGLFDWLFKQRR